LELPLDEAHRKRLRRPRIVHDFWSQFGISFGKQKPEGCTIKGQVI